MFRCTTFEVGLELRRARRIELELRRVDEHVRAGEIAELAELGRGPRGLHRPAPPEHDDLADARADDRRDRRVRRVRRRELLGGQREHAGDVERDVPVPDHDRALDARGRSRAPGSRGGRCTRRRARSQAHEPGSSSPGCRAADPSASRRRRRRRRRASELVVRDVAADLDVAEEAEARARGDLLERARDRLQLRVVGGDAEPDEPPRRRQALDHVDLGSRILARSRCAGRVEGRGPRAHDGDAELGVPSIGASMLRPTSGHGVRACAAMRSASSDGSWSSGGRPPRRASSASSRRCGGTAGSRARTASWTTARTTTAAERTAEPRGPRRGRRASVADLHGPTTARPMTRFELTARAADIRLASGRVVHALTFNGRSPGPELRVRAGRPRRGRAAQRGRRGAASRSTGTASTCRTPRTVSPA